jgi:hypothetical protein
MTTVPAPERRALLALIAVLGAVPVGTGLLAIIGGPSKAPGGERVDASLDSEYRFVNTFWTAAGVALWWSLGRPVERAGVTRLMLGLAAAGGLPRLLSIRSTGLPHPVFRATLVLELVVVPLVLLWHRRVLGGAGPRGR